MTQKNELSSSEEEYLEAIYTKQEGKAGAASTGELAACLGVRDASVTEMLKKLSEKGLINYTRYRGATLTEAGCEIATKVKRKHRLLAELAITSLMRRRARSNMSFRTRPLTISPPSLATRQRVLAEARYPKAIRVMRSRFQSSLRSRKGCTRYGF
jgi:DNA-binding MarR family transcriptional regulator